MKLLFLCLGWKACDRQEVVILVLMCNSTCSWRSCKVTNSSSNSNYSLLLVVIWDCVIVNRSIARSWWQQIFRWRKHWLKTSECLGRHWLKPVMRCFLRLLLMLLALLLKGHFHGNLFLFFPCLWCLVIYVNKACLGKSYLLVCSGGCGLRWTPIINVSRLIFWRSH